MEKSTIIILVTGITIIFASLWIFLMSYWILGKLGLWKWATYRRLKKKFKNLDFSDKNIEWSNHAIERKWRFKDVRRFSKYEQNGSELLYTFMVLDKLRRSERR